MTQEQSAGSRVQPPPLAGWEEVGMRDGGGWVQMTDLDWGGGSHPLLKWGRKEAQAEGRIQFKIPETSG